MRNFVPFHLEDQLPATTRMPLPDPHGTALVLVDDENVRLTAQRELGRRVPDYVALRRLCEDHFAAVEVHVFATSPLSRDPGVGVRVHSKAVPGKNMDIEVAVFLTRRFERGTCADTVLFVTGDQDFLALWHSARGYGSRAGFLAAPGRSLARALHQAPLGLLGGDVLKPTHAARTTTPRRHHGRSHTGNHHHHNNNNNNNNNNNGRMPWQHRRSAG